MNTGHPGSAPNVALPNEHASMVDTLGETELENLRLKPTLHEVFNLKGQYVIETHPGFIKHTYAHETADKGITLEETLGILVVEFKQFTSSTTNFGEHERDTPDLALVAQAVLAGELD
jgi:hypothetical protein